MTFATDIKILSTTSKTCVCGHPKIAHDDARDGVHKLACFECGPCWEYRENKP